jgi:hypothetical protein
LKTIPAYTPQQHGVAKSPAGGVHSLLSVRAQTLLVLGVIALALILRVAYYVLNPSLSVDEASLALNVMHRSYSDLFGQLDFNQAAPAGFLLIQKLIVQAGGTTSYALRFFPLMAGIVGTLLMYPVARAFAGRRAAVVALALFAISEPLISYASTNKQYSIDAAVTLGLYAMAIALPTRTGPREAVTLAIGGALAVWLSHPSAFVLAALGTVLIFDSVIRRRWGETALLSGAVTTWLLSFLVAYELTQSSVDQVRHSIASSAPSSLAGSGGQPGLLQTYGGMARSLLGIPSFAHGIRDAIAVAAMVLALAGFWRMLRVRPRHAVLLVLPAALALFACAIHLYPLYPRTFIFVIPALVILVAVGAEVLINSRRRSLVSVLAAGTLAALLGTTAYATIDSLRSPSNPDATGALRRLAEQGRNGDSLYVYLSAQYTFRYYVECGCFGTSSEARKLETLWPLRPASGHAQFAPALRSAPPLFIAGSETGSRAGDYRSEFRPLRGRHRVWVLVIDADPNAQRGLESFLASAGTRQSSWASSSKRGAASLFRYDLRSPS